jgi:hypothetical protein
MQKKPRAQRKNVRLYWHKHVGRKSGKAGSKTFMARQWLGENLMGQLLYRTGWAADKWIVMKLLGCCMPMRSRLGQQGLSLRQVLNTRHAHKTITVSARNT